MRFTIRPRHAALCVLGLPLIPFAVSSMGGITHLHSCSAATGPPFTVSSAGPGTLPVISSALVLDRDAAEPASCEGLDLLAQAQPQRNGTVQLLLPVVSTSTLSWHATVKVRVGGHSYPVRIGRVRVGQTVVGRVTVHVPKGDSKITTRLVVGP